MKGENKMTDYTNPMSITNEDVQTPEVEDTTPQAPAAPITGVVTGCKKLNVRKRPAVNDNNVLEVIEADTTLFVIEPEKATGEWYKVELAGGTIGFCMKKFITIE